MLADDLTPTELYGLVLEAAAARAIAGALASRRRYVALPHRLVSPPVLVDVLRQLGGKELRRCGEVRPDVDLVEVCLEMRGVCLLQGHHGWPSPDGYAAGMLRAQLDPVARLARRLPHLAEVITNA